ncbi:MAG: thioredoxin family protein [Casimicrobiaceae bacterium]
MQRPSTARTIFWALVGLTTALVGALPARGAPVRTEHVEAELVAGRTAIVPGETLTVALRLKLAPGWHTYWRNPGDSGLPTTLAWQLPEGAVAGPIQWPAPKTLPVGPMVNYGYEGEVMHLVDLQMPSSLGASPVNLAARAEWLVCKETCIPEGADLSLTLPVAVNGTASATATASAWADRIAATRAALPQPLAEGRSRATGSGSTVVLAVDRPPGAADPGKVYFFAHEPDRIEPSRVQPLKRTDAGFELQLPVSSQLSGALPKLSGVLTAANGFATSAGMVQAVVIETPVAGAVVAGPKPELTVATLNVAPVPAADGAPGLALAIALALVGGVLLNLMPCVFPVLSLKVLGFARHHDSKATLHAEAGAFAAGVLLTFLSLGFVLFAFRAAGEHLGWGFQLQSPAVVTVLALLFFVIAINLSGAFEFGQLVPSSLAGWTSKNRTLDAFGSGVLAVIIASPCTAPFMGAALGYAFAGTALTTLMVFGALGIGMALPYVLLAWFPGWRRRLPRSGAWMVRFKQFLAFPMYATVIWLAWVLGAQRDNDAVLRLLVVLLSVGFALWTWQIVRTGGSRLWSLGVALAAVTAVAMALPLLAADDTVDAKADTVGARAATRLPQGWIDYSPAKIAELRADGRTVFVDFTAAWCVTCQVNKRLVLDTDEIRAAFTLGNVALVRADWTRRDPVITDALAALGRNGVPVYVVYRPGRAPQVLSEILTKQAVLDAVSA